MKKKETDHAIDIMEISTGTAEYCLIGETPLIIQRMTEKAMQQLLLPKGRKTAAEKASTMKHNPYDEYRSAPYHFEDDVESDTLLYMPSVNFKRSICGAALDLPGATKSQLGRLVHTTGQRVCVFGDPKLLMSVVRSADQAKTPDVRTRVIVPEWACRIQVTYTKPIMREQTITTLLAAAGYSQGIGDWRPQKGSGNYGQFRIVAMDDPDFIKRTTKSTRKTQQAAMDNPVCYDRDTEDLLHWFDSESKRRGFEVVA